MKQNSSVEKLIDLYVENGLTMRVIAARCGISYQTVQTRLARAGVRRRPPKHEAIPKERLEELYTIEQWSLERIAEEFVTTIFVVRAALKFHSIPKRPYLKLGGKYADWLRGLKIGQTVEINLQMKKIHPQLHRAAQHVGIKISIKKFGDGNFKVTRKD